MTVIYEEIARRFPEAVSQLNPDNQDLPYVVMGELVQWLRGIPPEEMTSELVERTVDFQTWCLEQPRMESAEDDIFTIWVVAFFEKLFRSPNTRILIPRLTTKQAIIDSADYLKAWVDAEDYEAALRLFD